MRLADWLVERGIGETRMALVQDGEIVESRVQLEGIVAAGTRLQARLSTAGPAAVAIAEAQEYLLPKGAPGTSEGAAITIEVTREAIPGGEPWKRPLARLADGSTAEPGLPPGKLLPFPAPNDRLGAAGWLDLVDEARSAMVRFVGGELRVALTPAMTLIDVDGTLPPLELARAGAIAAARAIRRHAVGGSIGIDLPTVAGKGERQAVAEAFDSALAQPFERTAVNGFGFLQVVRPRRHASLFELAADRAPFEARALLRSAALGGPGPKRLVAHPAVIAILESNPAWLDTLARQAGGKIGLRADARLPMSAGHVEHG